MIRVVIFMSVVIGAEAAAKTAPENALRSTKDDQQTIHVTRGSDFTAPKNVNSGE